MVVEHEIIEQIEDEPLGRSLEWCVHFASRLGAPDPWVTLREMFRAGFLRLVGTDGAPMEPWQVESLWRDREPRADIAAHATDLGSKFAHG